MREISGLSLPGERTVPPLQSDIHMAAICPSPVGQPLSLHPHFLPLSYFLLSVSRTLLQPPCICHRHTDALEGSLALSHPLYSAHASDCGSITPIQHLSCPSPLPSKYRLIISRQSPVWHLEHFHYCL